MTTAGRAAATADLAVAVAEIARSDGASRAKKEKRIAEIVRVAVIAATELKDSSVEILDLALDVTESAASAAPSFVDVIANAVAFTPSVARTKGAAGQIRTAAYAAARTPRSPPATAAGYSSFHGPHAPGWSAGTEPLTSPSGPSLSSEPVNGNLADARSGRAGVVQSSVPSGPKIQWSNAASLALTLEVSMRRDDNVYLTPRGVAAAKTADTVMAVTPGADFRYGQNSLAHGSVVYKTAFTRYAEHTASSVALNSALADFGYDNGLLNTAANVAYEQTNQNSSYEAARSGTAILRRDVLNAGASLETKLFTRTSFRTGVGFNQSKYKTAELIGSHSIYWPLKLYFETSPKLALSSGATFSRVAPQDGGPKARDAYYNLGFRGRLFSRVTGEFSTGYRTRSSEKAGQDGALGFEGRLNYDPTGKTNVLLSLSRDFGAGPLGESLKSGSYSLQISSDPTPRWQLAAGLVYHDTSYGPAVFSNRSGDAGRTDSTWEGTLIASYMLTSWIGVSADYRLRYNSSNFEGAQFSNNIIGLSLALRY